MLPEMQNHMRPSIMTIRILKMIVMQTGSYNPMYFRPYHTRMDPNVVDSIQQRVYDQKNGVPTSAALAGVANQFITPSFQHTGEVPIVNGWGTPRGRFNMVIEIQMNSGTLYKYHIQGYTSHFDLSLQGSFDPNMVFYINSFVRINTSYFNGPMGIETRDHVTESAQVINGRMVSNMLNHDIYGLRPYDYYTVMQGHMLSDRYITNPHETMGDNRHALNGRVVQSSRANNLPSNLLSKMIETYQTGQDLLAFGQDRQDIYSRCRGYSDEGLINENGFFRQLSNISGMPDSTQFKMSELLEIDPNVLHPSITTFIQLDHKAVGRVHYAGQSEVWHRPDDRCAWVCSVLINAVPTIMMEMMITKLQFTAHNHDYQGTNQVLITGAKDLAGRDIGQSLNNFKVRFVHEVMRDLTFNNQETYRLTMTIDLMGDIIIDIEYGNQPLARYVSPAFCDALMAPVVTPDENVVLNNANDFSTLLNSFSGSHQTNLIQETI